MTRAAIVFVILASLTAGAWSIRGLGLFAQDLDATVADLRAGTPGGGRVYVGGGLRGGK